MDYLFHMDMQKDTVIHAFASVTLDPTNSNIPIYIDNITDVAVNGQSLGLDGYLDVGLYDTMEDLFVNFIGALTFSIIGYFSAKSGKNKIAKQFVPVVLPDQDVYKRQQKKRDFRQLWITRISAGCKANGMNYSTFMHGLKLAGIDMNRKMLSETAIHDPAAFTALCEQAKAAL